MPCSTLVKLIKHCSNSKGTVIPLIILKLPRSGSSWFTENLNKYATPQRDAVCNIVSFQSIYISKEIMQFDDVGQFSNKVSSTSPQINHHVSQEIENHLMTALRRPADKLSASKSWFPTGRYIADYVKSLKFLSTFRIVGFTLNLEHSYGMSY